MFHSILNSPSLRNLILLLTGTLPVLAGAAIVPALPAIAKNFSDYPQAELWVKSLVSMPGLIIAISAPFVRHWIEWFGKKSVIFTCTLLFILTGSSGYFFENNLPAMLAGRFFLGIAVAGIMVATTSLLTDYFQGPERSRYMGYQAACSGFAGVGTMLLASVISAWDWRLPFLIYTLASILLPGILLYLIQLPSSNKQPSISSDSIQQTTHKHTTLCYFLAATEVFILYAILTHLPFYAAQETTLDNTGAGLIVTLMLLVMSCTSLFYRYFYTKSSFSFIQIIGLIIISSGFLTLALLPSHFGLVLAMLKIGLGLGIIRPNVIMWSMENSTAQQRAKIMGMLTTCFFLGQFFSPLLTQPLLNLINYRGLFMVLSACLLSLCCLLIIYHKKMFKVRCV